MPRLTPLYILAAALMFATIDPARAGNSKNRPPNVVFIVADDLGWTDINSFDPRDRRFYETPHIDGLAAEGVKFTAAYTNGPNCAPTRAALLSGRQYPNNPVHTVGDPKRGKARFRSLIPPPNETKLPGDHVTFAERLRDSGYATAHMGKWHLGDDGDGTGPRDQGFDLNVGGYSTGHPSWNGGYFRPNNNPFIEDARDGEYLTDYLTRKAVDFIKENRDRPFLLYLPYYTVHSPLQAPESRVDHFRSKQPEGGHNRPAYAAMIASLDRGVGQILDALDELDLRDNTLVIFYSDNGGVDAADIGHWRATDNAPLRGGKGMLYEGGIRVPLIVRWPGVIEPGNICDEPVISTDFYPTLLDIAGIDQPSDEALDGRSLLPLLKKPEASLDRNALYWHFPAYLQADAQRGTWRTTPAGAIRAGPWKLIEFFETGRIELYDLTEDISEENDLSEEHPGTAAELHTMLKRWRRSVEAPMPKPTREGDAN